jgi:N utilization substance protein A
MSSELIFTIEQVSREKGINPEEIVNAIEDAILTASKKHFKGWDEIFARFNRESGEVELYGRKNVVETVVNPGMEISPAEAVKTNPEAQLTSTPAGWAIL